MPANSSDTSSSGPPGSGPRAIANPVLCRILLALTAVFVLLYQLGGRGLNEPDEGRYAEAGRGMMA